jgi:urease accessory protein
MLLNRMYRAALVGAWLVLTAETASAHHMMGGRTPSTFMEGLLSGVGHPVIGPDHLAFLVGVGIAVGIGGLSLLSPLLFLIAMACGVAAHVAAISTPVPN